MENDTLYWTRKDNGECKVIACKLVEVKGDRGVITTRELHTNGEKVKTSTTLDNLYVTKDAAIDAMQEYLELYAGFDREPFLNEDTLKAHKPALINIQTFINKNLEDFPNFDGVSFCDVRANGIQICGHHKQVRGYVYGDQITIDYECNNPNIAALSFVLMWKEYDTPEKLADFQGFIKMGEETGWN